MRRAALKLPGERDGKYLHARAGDDSFALHQWALDDDDDIHDMATVKLVNPAPWQTVKLLAQRHNSPSMLTWQWARFACGLWLAADVVWIGGEEWFEAEQDERFRPGDRIA